MNASPPHVVVVAGANGSGKSTGAPSLLRDALEVTEFVNADTIAAGISAFRPQSVAVAAERIMIARMRSLAAARENFAFETTLASRSFALWLKQLGKGGYRVHILFLWLRNEELAVRRVAERARAGGHDVPEDVVRSRYQAGLRNYFGLYVPLADSWQMLDNSEPGKPRLVATGNDQLFVRNAETWQRIQKPHV